MALSPEQLNETDERVLAALHTGRVTPQYLATELGVSRPYASERLKRLVEHGHVERLASGLYELVDDPRDASEMDPRSDAEARADKLERRNEELRERLAEAEPRDAARAGGRGVTTDPDLGRALDGVSAALRALEGQDPDVDMATSELEAVQEVLREDDA